MAVAALVAVAVAVVVIHSLLIVSDSIISLLNLALTKQNKLLYVNVLKKKNKTFRMADRQNYV